MFQTEASSQTDDSFANTSQSNPTTQHVSYNAFEVSLIHYSRSFDLSDGSVNRSWMYISRWDTSKQIPSSHLYILQRPISKHIIIQFRSRGDLFGTHYVSIDPTLMDNPNNVYSGSKYSKGHILGAQMYHYLMPIDHTSFPEPFLNVIKKLDVPPLISENLAIQTQIVDKTITLLRAAADQIESTGTIGKSTQTSHVQKIPTETEHTNWQNVIRCLYVPPNCIPMFHHFNLLVHGPFDAFIRGVVMAYAPKVSVRTFPVFTPYYDAHCDYHSSVDILRGPKYCHWIPNALIIVVFTSPLFQQQPKMIVEPYRPNENAVVRCGNKEYDLNKALCSVQQLSCDGVETATAYHFVHARGESCTPLEQRIMDWADVERYTGETFPDRLKKLQTLFNVGVPHGTLYDCPRREPHSSNENARAAVKGSTKTLQQYNTKTRDLLAKANNAIQTCEDEDDSINLDSIKQTINELNATHEIFEDELRSKLVCAHHILSEPKSKSNFICTTM